MAPVVRNNKSRTVVNVTRRVTNVVRKLQGGSKITLPAVKKFLNTERNIKILDDEIKIAFKKAVDKGVLSKEGRKYKVVVPASRAKQSRTDNKSSRSQVSIKQTKEQASSSKVGKRLRRVENLSEACMPARSAKMKPKNTRARNTLFSSRETLNTQERNVDGMEDSSTAIVEVPKQTVDLTDDQSSEAANRVQDNLPMDQDAEDVNRVQDNLPMDQDAEDVNEVPPPEKQHQEPVLESDEAPSATSMIEQEIL